MKLQHGIFISLILVTAMVAAGGAVLLASDSDARYDSNQDGMVSAQEARDGVRDYFAGGISQGAAVDLMLRSFAGVPVAIPTQLYTPTPTPTPTPMVSIPGAPRITGITPGNAGFAVQWARVAGEVRSYGVAWRVLPDGKWEHASRPGTVLSHSVWDLKNGASYAVFVQAINAAGYGEWSNGATVTPSGAPTPTRTPTMVPPTPTPTAVVAMSREEHCRGLPPMTIINPQPPTQMFHESSIRWAVSFNFWEHTFKNEDYRRSERAALGIASNGVWSLKVYNSGHGLDTYPVDSGTVSVNSGWNARNEIAVGVKSSIPVEVAISVNGVEYPVDIDDRDRRYIRSIFMIYSDQHSKYLRGGSWVAAGGNAGFEC